MMLKRYLPTLFVALLLVAPSAFAQDDAPAANEPAKDSATEAPATTPAEAPATTAPTQPPTEICDSHKDEDGDGMVDCADADCFEDKHCLEHDVDENSKERCHDFVDNDDDGLIDCDDATCEAFCKQASAPTSPAAPQSLPEEAPRAGETMNDVLQRSTKADAEHNDFTCSDGLDNDGDGDIDCQDLGCRYDPQVTVCRDHTGFRFSLVTGIAATANLKGDIDRAFDARLERLQARVLGEIPYIDDSFFLLSARLDRSPRLTFAHFQVPISKTGHYVAVNTGSGGLSTGFIVSEANLPLLDRAYYLLNPFEAGNGASIESGGPITPNNFLRYRVFASGGTGDFIGVAGGRSIRDPEDSNFHWTAGAQLHINLIGNYDRLDSPFIYNKQPLTLALLVGGKYDQRAVERFGAAHSFLFFTLNRFSFQSEAYFKYDTDLKATQLAWNATAVGLIIPQHLVFAADIGGFSAQDYPDDFRLEEDEQIHWRAALHWFWFRNSGLLSLRYQQIHRENQEMQHDVHLEAQFRY